MSSTALRINPLATTLFSFSTPTNNSRAVCTRSIRYSTDFGVFRRHSSILDAKMTSDPLLEATYLSHMLFTRAPTAREGISFTPVQALPPTDRPKPSKLTTFYVFMRASETCCDAVSNHTPMSTLDMPYPLQLQVQASTLIKKSSGNEKKQKKQMLRDVVAQGPSKSRRIKNV